jgi:hypothetical protein
VLQFLTLGFDHAEQVLPRFIEGLSALRVQIGSQFFKINPNRSKTV